MKKLFRKTVYISAIAAFLSFAGCGDFNSEYDTAIEHVAGTKNEKANGKAYLSVSINESSSRMISPTDITQSEITRAELLSKETDSESSLLLKNWQSSEAKTAIENMTGDSEILIDAGIYDFTLNLYVGESLCQTGTLSSVEVAAGNNPLSFSTKYAENGNGNLSVTLSWTKSERVASVKAGLFTISSLGENSVEGYEFTEIMVTADDENIYTASYARNEVASGAYFIRFELYSDDGTKLNTLEDVIQIATACSTQKTIPLSNVNTIYTISYEKNGGDWAEDFTPTEKHNANTAVILPSEENIARIGYEFAGWHTSEDGGETFSENTLLAINAGTADDFTLYAKWEPATVKYTVKHLLQNADDDDYTESEEDRETLYGKTESETEAVAKEYEHFTLTRITQEIVAADGSTVVEILYERELVTVSFDSMGGNTVVSQTFKYGGRAIAPNVPEKSSYDFIGWYTSSDDGETLSENSFNFDTEIGVSLTLYAKWGINATANNVAEKIAAMTKSGVVIVTGSIGYQTLSTIKEAINNKNFGIEIDLSETKNLTFIGYEIFKECTRLTNITLPESVTSIGNSAFYGCSGLTSIKIPESVTRIGDNAFGDCSGLESVYYGGTLEQWITISFSSGYSNPCYNGAELYTKGEKPTSVEISDSVKSIGDYAFSGCSGLTSIKIPESVTSIGDYAFYGCSGLTSIKIPDGVMSIGDSAFYGCSRLTSIEIPNSVMNIGQKAFYQCNGLTEMTIPFIGTSVTDTSAKFYEMFGNYYSFYVPASLKSLRITGIVTSIGNYAFRDCSGLTNIEIPESVTSIGDYAFYGCSGLESVYYGGTLEQWITISFSSGYSNPCYNGADLYIGGEKLTSVEISDSVTSIGDYAFYGCSGLMSIKIPESVTSIGFYAFYGCSGLTSIKIPEGVTNIENDAFYGCSGLTSIKIPEGVTNIGNYAFRDCSGLTSIEIPESVTSIEYSAFGDCSGLESVYYGGTLEQWITISFSSGYSNPCDNGAELYTKGEKPTSVKIPFTLTSIDSRTFSGCNGLTSVEIPTSVTSIGSGTFSGCRELIEITIPFIGNSVTDTSAHFCGIFGSNSDSVPTSLKTVKIIGSVTSIGDYAFSGCSGLSHIEIPDGVTSIGDYAFSGCSGLTSIKILESVTSIGTAAFSGCSGLTSIEIPEGVSSIENDAFTGCSGLTSIEIPEGVTSIGDNAFSGCGGLKNIKIPEGVTTIGDCAFDGCSGLISIRIPESVTSIGKRVFSGCTGLTEMTIPFIGTNVTDISTRFYELFGVGYSDGVPTSLKTVRITGSVMNIGDNAFSECSGLTSIEIPNSVKSIGNSAFYGCRGLTSINMPKSVTDIGDEAFKNCKELDTVYYGGTLEQWITISFSDSYSNPCCNGAELYTNGEKPTSLTITDSLTSIGKYALYWCSGLTEMTIPFIGASVTDTSAKFYEIFGSGSSNIPASLKTLRITGSVTSIGDSAFSGCSGLTSIEIPESVSSIGDSAFSGCSGLTNIEIPESVTSIGDYAFSGCSGLESVYYGGTLEQWITISFSSDYSNPCYNGADLYIGGEKLTSVEISDSVTSIGDYAFYGCSGLMSIKIPESVTSIGNSAFDGCSGLTSIKIPEGVSSIGRSAFFGCSGLTSIEIPSSVTSIGNSAFYGCSGLMSVYYGGTVKQWITISFSSYSNPCCNGADLYIDGEKLRGLTLPNSVTSIGNYVFYGCSGLECVVINNATSIGNAAFEGCSGLESVLIGQSVMNIGYSAFRGCEKLTTILYSGTVSQWKKVLKDSYWNQNVPATKVVCSDGEVEL